MEENDVEQGCGYEYDHDLWLFDEADGWVTLHCRRCGAEIIERADL
jgi:hypothetical protein